VAQLDKKFLVGQPIANPIQKNLARPANCQSNPIGQLDANCQLADWRPIGFWPIGYQFSIGKIKMALYLSY
jgi:hypothetical protein